jgi:uncharacterized protein
MSDAADAADPVDPVVTDDREHERYVLTVAGDPAGVAQYQRLGRQVLFTHTEIDPRYEGRGLASTLIRAALDDARAQGLAVLPLCPFVRSFIARHGEYLDLVPAGQRSRFDLPAPG